MKLIKRIAFLFLILIGIAVYLNYPKLNIISGFASKSIASNAFIAKRSLSSIVNTDNNVPLIKLATVRLDTNQKNAFASVFGLMERRTFCREGLGCVLVKDGFESTNMALKPKRTKTKSPLPYPFGHAKEIDTLFANIDYSQLNQAVSKAFDSAAVKKTRSVLVLYKNKIIAEQYTKGFSKDTPILGWSMAKSILATLYGTLEFQGKIDINTQAPVVAWQNDARKHITINNLLRMHSGLEWEEDYSKISDVTKMLFLDTDMTIRQKEKKSIAKPGELWNYSSGTSNLLSGILRDQFTTRQAYLDYLYTDLIDKIGMHSMIMEADMEGNYVGSSYCWATTRDWAKFGTLYLNNGNWNGEQLFSKDWITYITQPTKNADGEYGAHFWLNAGGKYPNAPRDMYSANGYQGQRIFIIPSKDLVIVRTGLAASPGFDMNAFLGDILQSID